MEAFNGKSYLQAWYFTVVVKLDNGVITGECEAFEEEPEST